MGQISNSAALLSMPANVHKLQLQRLLTFGLPPACHAPSRSFWHIATSHAYGSRLSKGPLTWWYQIMISSQSAFLDPFWGSNNLLYSQISSHVHIQISNHSLKKHSFLDSDLATCVVPSDSWTTLSNSAHFSRNLDESTLKKTTGGNLKKTNQPW